MWVAEWDVGDAADDASTKDASLTTGGPSYCLRATISGAAYEGEPQCTRSGLPGTKNADSPKSMSFIWLSASSRMFSSFMSLGGWVVGGWVGGWGVDCEGVVGGWWWW